MRRAFTLLLGLAASCAGPPSTVPDPKEPTRSEAAPSEVERVRRDLESSVRAKYGDRLVAEALSAPTFLLAKHYVGLPQPIVQPDGSYRYADPPVAMLVRRGGAWLAAKPGGGFVPVPPDKASGLDAHLNDAAFWSEAAFNQPTCTDAGGSLLWLKAEGRPATVRQGSCGSTAGTERLVFLALES